MSDYFHSKVLYWTNILKLWAMHDIDYSGSEALKQLHGELKKRDVVLVLSYVEDHVMHQLERDKLIDLIGKEHIFEFTKDVIVAYQKLPGMS